MAEVAFLGKKWRKRARYSRLSGEGRGGKRKLQMMRKGGNGRGVMWKLKTVVRFMRPARPWAFFSSLFSSSNSSSLVERPLIANGLRTWSGFITQNLRKALAALAWTSMPSKASAIEDFNAKMILEMYKSVGIHLSVDQVRVMAKELSIEQQRPPSLIEC